jgi:hypothetical protein
MPPSPRAALARPRPKGGGAGWGGGRHRRSRSVETLQPLGPGAPPPQEVAHWPPPKLARPAARTASRPRRQPHRSQPSTVNSRRRALANEPRRRPRGVPKLSGTWSAIGFPSRSTACGRTASRVPQDRVPQANAANPTAPRRGLGLRLRPRSPHRASNTPRRRPRLDRNRPPPACASPCPAVARGNGTPPAAAALAQNPRARQMASDPSAARQAPWLSRRAQTPWPCQQGRCCCGTASRPSRSSRAPRWLCRGEITGEAVQCCVLHAMQQGHAWS